MNPHFRDEGRGAPVVLLPGFGASLHAYDEVFAGREDQRLIAVDLPRTGESAHWAPSTPQGIAGELSAWLTRHGVSEYRVFGHSFGGLVALELCVLDRPRITGLGLASTPALGIPADARALLRAPAVDQVVLSMWQVATWRPAMRTYLQWLWGRSPLPSAVVDSYLRSIRAAGFTGAVVEALRSVAEYRLPLDALRAGAVPARVVWGERDPLVPVPYGEHLAGSIAAEFRVLPDTGHCIPEEQPRAVLEAIGVRPAGKGP